MKKPEIILIGGGGHCKSVIDVIECENKYTISGILDVESKLNQKILGYTIIGTDADISYWAQKNISFIITVGQIKSSEIREKLYTVLKGTKAELATVYSPLAYISKHSTIRVCSVVMHHAIINSGAVIGSNCIINTKALIEHDVTIGDHCHISTGAIVNGSCSIGTNCFVGSNAVLKNGISIANNVIIGAGAIVTKDIKESGVYTGIC